METAALEKPKRTSQKVQLVKGEFTPSETYDVVVGLINEKINFHKIQRLQVWEGDHKCEKPNLVGRINELEEEKKNVKDFISSIRGLGKNLKINGVLEISIAD